MDRESTKDVDPNDAEHREIGAGLLDEDMGPSSAMAHLYRGEIHRMKFWRERLDQTTYWAIVVMSAILTWSFSSRNNPHYVVLLGAAAVTAFLVIEARRYRGYDIIWRDASERSRRTSSRTGSTPPPVSSIRRGARS